MLSSKLLIFKTLYIVFNHKQSLHYNPSIPQVNYQNFLKKLPKLLILKSIEILNHSFSFS